MTNPNDPAFPAPDTINYISGERFTPLIEGLSKREHFASMFLQGLISKYSLQKPEDQDLVSKVAVELADTFIKTLND